MSFDTWWEKHGHQLRTNTTLSPDDALAVARAAWDAAQAGVRALIADPTCLHDSWDAAIVETALDGDEGTY